MSYSSQPRSDFAELFSLIWSLCREASLAISQVRFGFSDAMANA
jgi:hypothetical protein